MMNFAGALTQSCDTWFYQVGIKIGAGPIIEWSNKCGFGAKTGIPLKAEAEGRVPTPEYMNVGSLTAGNQNCHKIFAMLQAFMLLLF
jgi:cell division protein FtsI/penicillin-binding protein 2